MLTINKAFQDLIRPLSAEEYAELEESIITYGCRDPIVVWNDTIIDGHNRYRICSENDVAYQVHDMTYDFDTEDEVKMWIIKNQFGRRNLEPYQRAQLALQLKDLIAGKAKENQIKSLKQYANNEEDAVCQKSDKREDDENTVLANLPKRSVNTREELAKIAGVSGRTIDKVEVIETKAPDPVKDAARDNVISINKAYEITKEVQDLPKDKQAAEADRLLNERTERRSREIDRRYNLSKTFANAVESIAVLEVTEEALNCYLEYSPGLMSNNLPNMCDQGIAALQQIKALYTSRQVPKAVQ